MRTNTPKVLNIFLKKAGYAEILIKNVQNTLELTYDIAIFISKSVAQDNKHFI